MKNGEKTGGSAGDEQAWADFGDKIPAFGEYGDQVQFEDSDDSIDMPVEASEPGNESDGSTPEESREDFESAQSKLQDARWRYDYLYFGYSDSVGDYHSHGDAYRTELDRRLGRDGFVDSKLDFISYEDFIAEGHTLEEFSEAEKEYTEMADAIEAIDMSDFVDPGENASDSERADEISGDAEKQEQLKADFDKATKRFDLAYYGDGLSSEESGKRISLIDSRFKDLGERDILEDVEKGVLHPENISQDLIDKINHVAGVIEGLDLSEDNGSANESEGSKPEISKEDFTVARSKLKDAWLRWSDLYSGDFDSTSGVFSHSLAYRAELDKRLGRDGWVNSTLLHISYEDFIAEGHTLEELSEDEKKYTEMAEALEKIDMSDFVEPSEEASVDSDAENAEKAEKAKEAAFAELSSACDALRDAILDAGFGESNGRGGIKTNDLLEAKLKEIGEFDAFKIAIDSWAGINSDRASATIEDMAKTKAELERLTEVLKGLKADSAGDASKAEDYEKKHEQFAPEYKKAIDIFNAVIVWLGYVDSVNDTISSEGLDYLRSIGEYDNYTKMVKQASDYINKKSDPSEWPGMLEELKRITKVLNDGGGGEKAGDQEKKAEAIDKLVNTRDMKRIGLLLEKIGLDNTHGLDEAETILNSLNLAELERIQKEIDDELNGEGDKNHEANGENLEYLRSLNFGQWLAVKYDVPGPDSKYFNPNFFAADRKLQQQVMQEYMALFEADANYEKDRVFMVEELCKVEFAKKAMEEMGLDPTNTNMGDLEPMLNKMKIEDLNKLYRKVVYGPKPAPKPTAKPTSPKPSSKPTDPKPAEPKPADAEPSDDESDDDSGNPDTNSSVDSSEADDSSEDGESGADKDIAEKIKDIDKKMPATAEDVKAAFAASPDARRIYGEPDDETVSKTLEEIKVWKKLSDAQKADFLQNGIMPAGINMNDLNALMELRKKGILPKRGA